jgi:hypothetical protein
MEAHCRGYDILQILQTLLDIGNPTEIDMATHHIPAHILWDEQDTQRTLIRHLYVLLQILILTGHQPPH